MPDLYYVLDIGNDRFGGIHFHRRLKLKSRYPFPSPVGTEMYISLDEPWEDRGIKGQIGHIDHIFLQVIKIVDPVHQGYLVDGFHMVLTDKDDPSAFGICHYHAERIFEYLISLGWESI